MGDYSYSEHLEMFGGPPEPGEAYPDAEQIDLARKAAKEDPPEPRCVICDREVHTHEQLSACRSALRAREARDA